MRVVDTGHMQGKLQGTFLRSVSGNKHSTSHRRFGPILCSVLWLLSLISVAFIPARLNGSTQYSGEMKGVAARILKNRANRERLDEEYNNLKQELAKTVVLNSSSKEEGYDNAIHILEKMDHAIEMSNAGKDNDIGAAAQVLGKETTSFLIEVLEPTQPEAALALKVLKASTDTSVVVGKMVLNRKEDSEIAANVADDLNALNRLIAKDKDARQTQHQDSEKPVDNMEPRREGPANPDDDLDEINRWIDGGDRSAFGSDDTQVSRAKRDSFYARYPILDQFRDVASFRSPSDEFDKAGGFSLLAVPPSFDPSSLSPDEFEGWLVNQANARSQLNGHVDVTSTADNPSKTSEKIPSLDGSSWPLDLTPAPSPAQPGTLDSAGLPELQQTLHNLKQQQSSSAQTLKQAETELQLERENDAALQDGGAQRGTQISIPIPRGWVKCECPAQHPGAGIFVNGVQWHTPALHCP